MSLDLDYADVVFDRPAALWRINVRGELLVGDDGQLRGWADFSDAYAVKRSLDPQPIPGCLAAR